MKYSCDLEIGLPRGRVIELFDNPGNLSRWQPDLVSFEAVSGVPGQPGARSRLLYRMGKREVELIETITERKLPDEFSGTYESSMGCTWIRNRFVDGGASTRWLVDTEFKGKGIMRILALFMGGVISKQTFKTLQNFKVFAESQPR